MATALKCWSALQFLAHIKRTLWMVVRMSPRSSCSCVVSTYWSLRFRAPFVSLLTDRRFAIFGCRTCAQTGTSWVKLRSARPPERRTNWQSAHMSWCQRRAGPSEALADGTGKRGSAPNEAPKPRVWSSGSRVAELALVLCRMAEMAKRADEATCREWLEHQRSNGACKNALSHYPC